jgi:hypothetical protein
MKQQDFCLLIGNQMIAELNNVTNQITGALITGATISVRVTDLDDNDVSGETWPVAMIEGDSGDYTAVIPETVVIVEGTKYRLKYVMTSPVAQTWEPLVTAKRRTG